MTRLIELIRNGEIEEIEADLKENKHNRDYINMVDKDGNNALMNAISYSRCTDIIELLIELGANIDVVNGHGSTLLMYAKQYGYTDIVKLLNNVKRII